MAKDSWSVPLRPAINLLKKFKVSAPYCSNRTKMFSPAIRDYTPFIHFMQDGIF